MDAREKILRAAARVFAEAGSRGATTRRIAEAAGVNEVTLFRHFGSKEKLLREALLCAATRVHSTGLPAEPRDPAAELVGWAREQLEQLYHSRALIRTGMAEYEEHPEASSHLCQGPLRVANELNAYLLRLRERGAIAGDCDTRAASALLMGAIFSDAMGRDIMPERFPYPLESAAARYVHLFLRAVGLRSGQGHAGSGEAVARRLEPAHESESS